METTVEKIHREFKTSSDAFFCQKNSRENLLTVGLTNQVKLMDLQELYPIHKVINRTRVDQLCVKYKLIFGLIERYVGKIPNKNLEEIISFRKNHSPYHYLSRKLGWLNSVIPSELATYTHIPVKNFNTVPKGRKYEERGDYYIVAPEKDFLRGSSRGANDPIVLFEDSRFSNVYVIVTAWGDEAKDEQVFNEKLN